MLAVDSVRTSPRRWRFRATNVGSTGTARAFVYCARRGNLTREVARFIVPDRALGSGTAECDNGKKAVAGGFNMPDARNTNLVTSKRVGADGWGVTVYNATGSPRTYVAVAYCRQIARPLRTVSRTIIADDSKRYGQSVSAFCDRSERLHSGGFEAQYEGEAEFANLGIVHKSKRGRNVRSWRVTAFAPIGTPRVTAYAYCQAKN